MGYYLLWLETALAAILAVALVVRGMASWRIRAASATLMLVLLALLASAWLFSYRVERYFASLLLLILLIVAAGWLVYRTRRRSWRWRAGILALATLLGIGLLWGVVLGGQILAVATATVGAVAAMLVGWNLRRSGWFTWSFSVPVWLVPLGICVGLTMIARHMVTQYGLVGLPVRALVAVAVVAGVAQLVLIGVGWLRRGDEGRLAAASWPAGRLSAVFALALGLDAATLWSLDQNVRAQLETLRVEAGALASTAAPPRVPDSRNAAVIYQQAFDLFNSLPELSPTGRPEDKEKFEWWDHVSKQAAEEPASLDVADPRLRETMAHLQPVLALVRRGAAMPDCYFERSWGAPSMSMLLGDVARLGGIIREGLLVDAVIKAKEGQTAEAMEDAATLFRLAAHLRQEPIAVSLLVSVRVDTTGLRAVEAILAATKPAAAQLELLSPDRSIPYTWAFRRVTYFEQALGLATFREVSTSGAPFAFLYPNSRWLQVDTPPRNLFVALYRLFLLEGDLQAYREDLAYWVSRSNPETSYHLQGVPWPPSRDLVRTGPQGPHLVTDLSTQTYSSVWFFVGRGDATLRLAQLAVAMGAYRDKHGAYPEKLDQLVPEQIDHLPIDPFDGAPLKMLRNKQGLVLYSIGPDKKDDRGPSDAKDWRSGDLAIRLAE